ncbi:MAG: heavy metal-binding domain-containing protein [Elusimicrobiota bacterium]
MKKFFVFCSMLLASFLLVNRAAAMSCHGGGGEDSGGHQHEEKAAAKPEKAAVRGTFYSKTYVCPMHPEIKSDKPGKCPECGMKLKKKQVLMTYACPEKDCEYRKSKPGKCYQHNKELIKTEVEQVKPEDSNPLPEEK